MRSAWRKPGDGESSAIVCTRTDEQSGGDEHAGAAGARSRHVLGAEPRTRATKRGRAWRRHKQTGSEREVEDGERYPEGRGGSAQPRGCPPDVSECSARRRRRGRRGDPLTPRDGGAAERGERYMTMTARQGGGRKIEEGRTEDGQAATWRRVKWVEERGGGDQLVRLTRMG